MQDGAMAAVEAAEFWIKFKWDKIKEAWGSEPQGILSGSPYYFHLNLTPGGAVVSCLRVVLIIVAI